MENEVGNGEGLNRLIIQHPAADDGAGGFHRFVEPFTVQCGKTMMRKPLSRQPFKDAADFGGLCLRFRAECPGAVTTPVQLGQQTFGMKEFQRHPDGCP